MFKVATAHDLYRTIVNINVCVEFKLFKVKVPLIFFGTVGFSRRRDGRYSKHQRTTLTFLSLRNNLLG